MSTRANIKIVDSYIDADDKKHTNELLFYRHSDGYPEGAMPTLEKFMNWVKTGKIRNNIGQASGWLVIIGAIEYKTVPPEAFISLTHEGEPQVRKDYEVNYDGPEDFKASSYEPTYCIHGDIEYLYELDLTEMEIRVFKVNTKFSKDFKSSKQSFKKIDTKKF